MFLALLVGIAAGPWGAHLLHPVPAEDAGAITTLAQLALVTTLFALGLRLRVPLEWRAWRLPLRLAAVTFPLTVLLLAASAYLVLDLSFAQSLLVGVVLAPGDPVLACNLHPPGESSSEATAFALAAEGGLTSALAAPAVLLVVQLAGFEAAGAPLATLGGSLWTLAVGALVGWSLGRVAWRWIAMLDRERHGDVLEELGVLASGLLAYALAAAVHADGVIAVLCTGLALAQAGGAQQGLGRRGLGLRVLRIAGRLERLAGVVLMVLAGALLAVVDLKLRVLLLALVALGLVRPLTAGIALSRAELPGAQRRMLGWCSPRGAAVLYAAGVAVDQGIDAPMARELWALGIVTVVATFAAGALAAAAQRVNSAGTVDLR